MNLSEADIGVVRNEVKRALEQLITVEAHLQAIHESVWNEVKRALEQLITVEEHLQALHESVLLDEDYRVEFDSFRIDYPIKDATRWKTPEMQERIETIRSSLNAIEKRLVVGEAQEGVTNE